MTLGWRSSLVRVRTKRVGCLVGCGTWLGSGHRRLVHLTGGVSVPTRLTLWFRISGDGLARAGVAWLGRRRCLVEGLCGATVKMHPAMCGRLRH